MEKKIETTREELAKIEEGLEKFEILSKERGVSYTNCLLYTSSGGGFLRHDGRDYSADCGADQRYGLSG